MINSEYKKTIENEFTQYYGKTISELMVNHPQYDGYPTNMIINEQNDLIVSYIRGHNPDFKKERMSGYQIEVFDKALIMQIKYVLSEGNYSGISGYDITTNTMVDKDKLYDLRINQTVKDDLEESGLCYRGMGRGGHFCRRRWL